jgi:FkbM family methyltransferase
MKHLLKRLYNMVYPPVSFPNNTALIGSYSQNGEDLVIDAILGCKQSGVYVDIGANHPVSLSNTKRFYDREWTGINIEPNPDLVAAFHDCRPRDINLNVGISDKEGVIPFYIITPHTLSTFDKQYATRVCRERGASITRAITIPVFTLRYILTRYLKGREIDFISIDTEGNDMKVLAGNDWMQFRPNLVLIETTGGYEKEIVAFMQAQHYTPVFRTAENAIFVRKDDGDM